MDAIIKTPQISSQSIKLGVRSISNKPNQDKKKSSTRTATELSTGLDTEQSSAQRTYTTLTPSPSLADPITETIVKQILHTHQTEDDLAKTNQGLEHFSPEYQEQKEKAEQEGRELGYQAGYDEGMQDAHKTIRSEIDGALKQIGDLAQSFEKTRAELFAQMEDHAVDVVWTALTKILGQLALEKKLAQHVVATAIAHIKQNEAMTIRVCPSDYAILQASLQSRQQPTDVLSQDLKIVSDARVELGGCFIETHAGNLDARLEVQLQQLKETLLSTRHSQDLQS